MGQKTLNYGMIGGSIEAFIGDVHRSALAMDSKIAMTAGCFSTRSALNQQSGEVYGVAPDRVYCSYIEMAEKEAKRDDKIDFVVITTPNKTHYEIAKKFLECGFHVSCEKPLCWTVEQGQELADLAKEKGLLFMVTYAYTGNCMAKQAKKLIEDGEIGKVINVTAEFLQEWLIDEIGDGEESTEKLSMWRQDPNVAGLTNCVGDLGTHAENMVYYMTGLKIKKLSAVLDYYGKSLEMNANMLVELENGAHGHYSCSQVCVGHSNGLSVRIFGTKGAIEWQQEQPNLLYVTKKGQPMQIYNRGMGYLTGQASAMNRLPSGHPEGLYVAFANIYTTFSTAVQKTKDGDALTAADLDFPTIEQGIEGVKFIHAIVQSHNQGSTWVSVNE